MPRILTTLCPLACLLACSSMAAAQERPLAHMVFFTLREDSPENRQRLVDACHEHLAGHQGVIHFSAGEIADELRREVNDRQFDVALHLVFQSKQAHDRYQTHPRHLTFIEQNKQLWSQVRVFDSYLKPDASPRPQVLQAKLDFSFAQLSLGEALKTLEAELTRAEGPPLRIEIQGDALQQQGITRNQEIRDFSAQDQPVEKILTELMVEANPIRGAKLNSPQQMLVWVVSRDGKAVLVTTRESAEKNGHALPEPFRPR